MKKITLIITFVFVYSSYAQNKSHFEAINLQIWEPFTTAFETSDYNLFGSLHSDALVRVNGDGKRIQNKTNYIKGYETRWANNKQNQTISFRFLERIVNNESASERGIYKLTINPNTDQEQSYFGKFHVVLRMENNSWKILIDYDSSEKNSINEDTYKNAFAIDDFDKH